MTLNSIYVDNLIKTALLEDINYLDTTTDYLIVGNSAACVNVVILEHCGIGKIVTVISSASNRNGILLERTHTRECLSCVGNRSLCTADNFNSLVCCGCNTAHMLNKVESRSRLDTPQRM